jgi:hypothetical protein
MVGVVPVVGCGTWYGCTWWWVWYLMVDVVPEGDCGACGLWYLEVDVVPAGVCGIW